MFAKIMCGSEKRKTNHREECGREKTKTKSEVRSSKGRKYQILENRACD